MKHPAFCPACGAPTSMRVPDGDDHERAVCTQCDAIHYINPKIVCGAVCLTPDNSRILLCKRAIEPRKGFWTIPAGYMECGETTEECAMREAWEEAFANIAIEEQVAIYSIPRISQVQIHYRARLQSEDVKPGPESLDVRLVTPEDIPWDDLAFPTVTWLLRDEIKRREQLVDSVNPRMN